jgi:hypothetical protein
MRSTRYACQFLMKPEFSRQTSVKNETSNIMKIRSVGADLFHADGQTYMTKIIAPFRNFANATKNDRTLQTQC